MADIDIVKDAILATYDKWISEGKTQEIAAKNSQMAVFDVIKNGNIPIIGIAAINGILYQATNPRG